MKITEIKEVRKGFVNIFIKHTSASLTLNENYDPAVQFYMEKYFNRAIKENEPYYEHTSEGADDMTAQIKSTLIGTSITIPITGGNLNL